MEVKYMRVDKVIVRAAVSTLAAILVLFAVMILALSFIFPSTMMQIAYDLGMDGASVTCAKRAYAQTDETYYIAFATQVAIASDNDEQIEDCGLHFIGDDPQAFDNYCTDYQEKLDGMNGTYDQYVYGQVSLAQYRQGKTSEAVTTAFTGLHSAFPKNNAAVILAMATVNANDAATVSLIKTEMNELSKSLTADTDKAYLAQVLALCERVG